MLKNALLLFSEIIHHAVALHVPGLEFDGNKPKDIALRTMKISEDTVVQRFYHKLKT